MDKKLTFLDKDKNAIYYAISFKETLNQIISIHNLSPQISFFVGKIGILTHIFSSLLLKNKEDQLLIDIDLNKNNYVKSYINNLSIFKIMVKNPYETGKLEDIFTDFGTIKFTRKLKGFKENQQTIVNKDSKIIEQDFVKYFYDLEDKNILIKTDVKYSFKNSTFSVEEAGGIAIVPYPQAHSNYLNFLYYLSKDKIDILENANNDPLKILKNFMGNIQFKLIDEKDIFYNCDCSYNYALNLIKLLKYEELEDYRKEYPIVKCEFCNKEYIIKEEDLKEILNKYKK